MKVLSMYIFYYYFPLTADKKKMFPVNSMAIFLLTSVELVFYSKVLNISQEFTVISAIPPPSSISLKIHIFPLFPASPLS